jgi:CubicO group peptidase (beta-lactamase class C family)
MRHERTKTLAALLTLAVASGAAAQKLPPGNVIAGELGRRLDAAVQRAGLGFWGAVLAATNGEPVLVRTFGLADRSKLPMLPQSLFDLGHATQQLTAIAALRMSQDGLLDLQDPIAQRVPEWPADKAGITFDHLLLHTSGLPADAVWAGGAAGATKPAIAAIARTQLLDPPGRAFHYSALNAILLAALLEEIGGQRFDKLIVERVLKPGRMLGGGPLTARFDSRYVTWRSAPGLREGAATEFELNWAHRGARGVLASALDVHGLLERLTGGHLLSSERLEQLWRPVSAGDALTVGPFAASKKEFTQVSSQFAGYRTRWLVDRASRSWIIVLTETAFRTDAMVAALADELASSLQPPPAAQAAPGPAAGPAPAAAGGASALDADRDRFVGTFEWPGGGTLTIEADGQRLRLCGTGLQPSVRLVRGAWPPSDEALLRRCEDRGLAVLDRVFADDASVFRDGFAGNDGVLARIFLDDLVLKHGAKRRIDLVGTVVGKPLVSWFRIEFERTALLVTCPWANERQFGGCMLAPTPSPFTVALDVVRADVAAGTTSQGVPLIVTVEGEGTRRRLVFEDATPGAAGLVECPLVP